jgi:hypothetical protein
MKNIIFLLFILSVLSISCKKEITKPIAYGSGNDYLIYEKVLQYQFAQTDVLIILQDSTKGEFIDTLHIINIKERIPALLEETLKGYITNKKLKIKLKNIPNIKSLVFESEIKNEPDNSVNVWLSNIGYDDSEIQAIATLGFIYGPEAGGAILFFMIKENNEWNIEDVYGLWVC